MSETQEEYETDAKPTPGPVAKGVTSSDRRRIAKVLKGTDMVGEHNTHCDIHSKTAPIQEQEPVANADLIVAAFNSAQEAREMGYDPQKAVEALPSLLRAVEKAEAMMRWVEDHPEEASGDQVDAYWKLRDALANAEGSENA